MDDACIEKLLNNDDIWEKVYEQGEKKHYTVGDKQFSVRFRKKMNRLFRERMGSRRALHPEVDNVYELIRSSLIRKFLYKKPLDR